MKIIDEIQVKYSNDGYQVNVKFDNPIQPAMQTAIQESVDLMMKSLNSMLSIANTKDKE